MCATAQVLYLSACERVDATYHPCVCVVSSGRNSIMLLAVRAAIIILDLTNYGHRQCWMYKKEHTTCIDFKW